MNKCISVHQFLCILFSGAVLLPFSVNRAMLFGLNGINISVSALFCALLFIAFLQPAYNARITIKKSKTINFLYLFYFIFMGIYNLSLFLVFVANVLSPNISTLFIALGVCVVAAYGAFKGIKTLARSSGVIIFMVVATVIVFAFAAAFRVRIDNLKEYTLYLPQIAQGAFSFFSRTFIIPASIFLFEFSNEKPHKKFIFWSVFSCALLCVVILFSIGSLGSYFYTQLFPVFRLSELISIGPITKAEVFFLGVFLLGLIIQISVVIFLSSECLGALFKKKRNGLICSLFAVVIIAFSILVSSSVKYQHIVFSDQLLLFIAAVFAIIIPIIASVFSKPAVKKVLVVILIFPFILSGCSESGLQDKMMVSGMYLDKSADGVTVALIASHSEENQYYEASGESIKTAIDATETKSGKNPVFSHDMIIFLSPEIANENIFQTLDFFLRYYEIIPSSRLIYCNLSKEELAANTDEAMKEVSGLISKKGVKNTDIVELANAFLDKGGNFSLPVFQKNENYYSIIETAIYKEGKIYKILNQEESKDYLIVMGEIKETSVVIENEKVGKITFMLRNIKVRRNKDEFFISCDADICECEKGFDKLLGAQYYENFEDQLSLSLYKKTEAVFLNTASEKVNISVSTNVNRMEEEINPLF